MADDQGARQDRFTHMGFHGMRNALFVLTDMKGSVANLRHSEWRAGLATELFLMLHTVVQDVTVTFVDNDRVPMPPPDGTSPFVDIPDCGSAEAAANPGPCF